MACYNLYIKSVLSVAFALTVAGCLFRPSAVVAAEETSPGDRVTFAQTQPAAMSMELIDKGAYRLGPGDTLFINIQGRSRLDFPSTSVTVSSTGSVSLPMIGDVEVAGKTITQAEEDIRSRLAEFYRHFTLSVELTNARTVRLWALGEVVNPGLMSLPAVSTAGLSALQAGIKDSGSVRRVELIRGEGKQIVDLYRIMVLGDTDADIEVESGDKLYAPMATRFARVQGEVMRDGKYEMVTLAGEDDVFRIRDLLALAMGTTPSAAMDKAYITRIDQDGRLVMMRLDLRVGSDDLNMQMQAGDTLAIPSISAFQPIIRLVGEFKGQGVYQRSVGPSGIEIENKTGIYVLKQGQTVYDVITATGGITPQADLSQAYIQRETDGNTEKIPVDLDRLIVKQDLGADKALNNGDMLVLPALADKVHVFGEVTGPGSYSYSPSRNLLEYIGDAGGPTLRAKLTDVRVIRGTAKAPQIAKVDVKNILQGKSKDSDFRVEAGDVVYVPSKLIGDWRDISQFLLSGISLLTVLNGK